MKSSPPDTITLSRASAEEAAAQVDALAQVLVDCVEGGASVSFMWPLPMAKAQAFWRGVADGVARGERALLLARVVADGDFVIEVVPQAIECREEGTPVGEPPRAVGLEHQIGDGEGERRGEITLEEKGVVVAAEPSGELAGTGVGRLTRPVG